jgi:hypothetical protein
MMLMIKFSLHLNIWDVTPIHGFSMLLEVEEDIRNRDMHRQLKEDLVEHIWQRFGQNQA